MYLHARHANEQPPWELSKPFPCIPNWNEWKWKIMDVFYLKTHSNMKTVIISLPSGWYKHYDTGLILFCRIFEIICTEKNEDEWCQAPKKQNSDIRHLKGLTMFFDLWTSIFNICRIYSFEWVLRQNDSLQHIKAYAK